MVSMFCLKPSHSQSYMQIVFDSGCMEVDYCLRTHVEIVCVMSVACSVAKIGPAGSVDVALDVMNAELNQPTSRTIKTSLCESCKCWKLLKVEIMKLW